MSQSQKEKIVVIAVVLWVVFFLALALSVKYFLIVNKQAEKEIKQVGTIEVYFSPKGGCTEAVVREIGKARFSIHIQAYSFTSAPILDALTLAEHRGVKVVAAVDGGQFESTSTIADDLARTGVEVRYDTKHAIAHNKIMLIDGETILTGSFNFTAAAEKSNAENLLVIRDNSKLYTKYEENFENHFSHSTVEQEMKRKK